MLNSRGNVDAIIMAESGFVCSKAATTAAIVRPKIGEMLCSNEIRFWRYRLSVIKI
jgi:hypothetical protein